jgi:hypothetical protein
MSKCVQADDKSIGVNIEGLARDSCIRQNRKSEVGSSIKLAQRERYGNHLGR